MTKATIATPKATIHLTKYPKMVQRYFINLDDVVTEVYRVNTKAQAVDGAQQYDVITSTGNTHTFATEVTEVIKLSQADKNREIARLKAEFASGKIDHQKFADSLVTLL